MYQACRWEYDDVGLSILESNVSPSVQQLVYSWGDTSSLTVSLNTRVTRARSVYHVTTRRLVSNNTSYKVKLMTKKIVEKCSCMFLNLVRKMSTPPSPLKRSVVQHSNFNLVWVKKQHYFLDFTHLGWGVLTPHPLTKIWSKQTSSALKYLAYSATLVQQFIIFHGSKMCS